VTEKGAIFRGFGNEKIVICRQAAKIVMARH
jgi:hypothetical protein